MPRDCEFCGKSYTSHGDHFREDHPIECSEVRKRLENYIHGKLEAETDERVICHLADCSECMDRLDTRLGELREGRV